MDYYDDPKDQPSESVLEQDMGMFSWIFGRQRSEQGSMTGLRALERRDGAQSDAFPTVEDLKARFKRSGMFRPEAVERFALGAAQFLRDGLSYTQTVDALVRSGDRLTLEEVKALGFPASYVVGRDFLEGIVAKNLVAARGSLEDLLHLAASQAHQLHSLRNFERDEVRHVVLVSPGGARETLMERRYNNRKIGISEAVELVMSRGDQIRRSTFAAVVYGGD